MNKDFGSLSIEDIEFIHKDYENHIPDGEISRKFGMIAVMDVLGWKKLVGKDDIKTYFALINSLRSNINDIFLRCTKDQTNCNVKIFVLSDTIAVCLDGSYPFCEWNLFQVISKFITEAIKKGFAFRGAISRGEYYTNSLGNVFVGEAFYEAVKYCEATDWAGVIITDSLANALFEKNTVKDLNKVGLVEYDKIPYKEGIKPNNNNLVLVPYKEFEIKIDSDYFEPINFKSLYKNIMLVDGVDVDYKYKNTCAFIDYIITKGY